MKRNEGLQEVFSERLLQKMNEYDLSQSALAKRCGVTRATISYYINGGKYPTRASMLKLSSVLHCSDAWLAGYDVAEDGGPTPLPIISEPQEKYHASADDTTETLLKMYLGLSADKKELVVDYVQMLYLKELRVKKDA